MWKRKLVSVCAAATAAVCSWVAAPTAVAAPEADAQGYVDSTARCGPPSDVVVFGSTSSSRVAICESADGKYQYRGVRVRDGARLIVPATRSGDGFTAENDGITYTVTEDALVVSDGARVIREETMVDFHGSTPSGDGPGASPPPATSTPKKPLPPPLPAEVGGS